MSEETIIDKTVVNEKPQQKRVESKQAESKKEVPASSPEPKKDGDTKKVVGVSAMSAAAGVVAGLLTPVQVFPQTSEVEDEDALEDSSGNTYEYEHPEDGNMQVATTVDDSMSFSEAFAAARREVGPGGLFTWHGHTYGTFYAEEWNAMSEEDKEQYWADVHETTSHLNELNNEGEVLDLEDDDQIGDGEILTEPEDGWDEEGEVIDTLDDLADAEIVDGDSEIEIDSIDDGNGEVLLDGVPVEDIDGSLDVASDDLLEGGSMENPDVDLLASNFEDPDIPIDNDIDMSDFA